MASRIHLVFCCFIWQSVFRFKQRGASSGKNTNVKQPICLNLRTLDGLLLGTKQTHTLAPESPQGLQIFKRVYCRLLKKGNYQQLPRPMNCLFGASISGQLYELYPSNCAVSFFGDWHEHHIASPTPWDPLKANKKSCQPAKNIVKPLQR